MSGTIELTEAKLGSDGGGGGSKQPLGGPDIARVVGSDPEAPKATIVGENAPAPFTQYSGKDYTDLYGHPDRWSWLDSSEFDETDEMLVMKTHSFISKAAAIVVWAVGLAVLASTGWAIYLYVQADFDPVSPRYYQSKLCASIDILNEQLLLIDGGNETLLLECDISSVPVVPVVGDFFWVLWVVMVLVVTFLGCCAPPDRQLVLEKDQDIGYVREKNWNCCSICCTRAHCGQPRTICEFTPSVVYATFETEKRIDGVGGWGVTRWGLTNPTKVVVLRDLHDGAMLHTIDAHDILCCYYPTCCGKQCCLKEAEFFLVTLKQRLESHLRAV